MTQPKQTTDSSDIVAVQLHPRIMPWRDLQYVDFWLADFRAARLVELKATAGKNGRPQLRAV